MRRSIGCLVTALAALAALRHIGAWPHGAPSPRPGATAWWGALSFALAAVVDTDRDG